MRVAYADPLVTLHQGDALDVLACLEPESVQCVVTSPPYWGLRLYEYEGAADGFGNEKLHDCLGWARGERCSKCYVCKSLVFLDAIKRVLRRDGVCFWNLGDSYAGSTGSGGKTAKQSTNVGSFHDGGMHIAPGLKPKDLVLIPQRIALAAQAAGWWVRSDIIWAKPNPMPESTTDRPTRSYEHILMLTKAATYYWDAEAVREPSTSPEQEAHNQRYAKPYAAYDDRAPMTGQPGNVNNVGIHSRPGNGGRNIRDVWNIATQPYPEAHFATFPEDIPDRAIRAATREGDTVLDPFAGSGTTLAVAKRLGRRAVGIEISEAYVKLASQRIEAETARLL